MNLDKDILIDWTKQYIDEVIGALCILILVFLIIFLKRQYVIAILGCVCIFALSIEKRAKVFDKTVSILVIFSLAVGFVLIN